MLFKENGLEAYYGLNCIPLSLNSNDEAPPLPPPNVTVFGDGSFKEVTRLNEVMRVGPWSSRTDALYEEEEIAGLHANRGHSEKVAVCKPRREASGETSPVGTFILDLQPPKL